MKEEQAVMAKDQGFPNALRFVRGWAATIGRGSKNAGRQPQPQNCHAGKCGDIDMLQRHETFETTQTGKYGKWRVRQVSPWPTLTRLHHQWLSVNVA